MSKEAIPGSGIPEIGAKSTAPSNEELAKAIQSGIMPRIKELTFMLHTLLGQNELIIKEIEKIKKDIYVEEEANDSPSETA